jgi:serine/threonine protein kinase
MSLNKGQRLGAYEILDVIGKGGMGEVYCARDTRLNREVAIKVSSEEFTERFEREARAIAALSCRCPLREGKILDGERTARNSSTCLLTVK